MKVTTIKEALDVSKFKANKLNECLLTFEMAINEKYVKKSKSVTFKADVEDDNDELEGDAMKSLLTGRYD